MSKPTKWLCAWQRLRSVWSECSLSALRKLGSLTSYWAHSKDSDQTGWMPRLIWVFAGRAGHFVGFYMLLLIFESFFSHNENHVLCPWRSAKKCHNCLTIELYIQKMQVQNNSQCRPWPEHDLVYPVYTGINVVGLKITCTGFFSILLRRAGRLVQSGASLTANQGVAGSSPCQATFFHWDWVMKKILRSFSFFHWFKKGRCQLLAKEWALITDKLPRRLAQE